VQAGELFFQPRGQVPGQESRLGVGRVRSSDPTKRFFAQLSGDFVVQGHEHRFYSEAGKYTGVFWNVTESQANALSSLDLVSVDEARLKAIEVEVLDLGEPSIGGDAPDPPRLAVFARARAACRQSASVTGR
jgi:hypothetical protein